MTVSDFDPNASDENAELARLGILDLGGSTGGAPLAAVGSGIGDQHAGAAALDARAAVDAPVPEGPEAALVRLAKESAIAPAVLEDAGVRALCWDDGRGARAVRRLVGRPSMRLAADHFPVLIFPDWSAGDIRPTHWRRIRFNKDLDPNKASKYLSPKRTEHPPMLYITPMARRAIQIADVLYVVEGEKKTLSVLSRHMSRPEGGEDRAFAPAVPEFAAVGFSGAQNFCGPDGSPFPELVEWAKTGKRIVLVFDQDTETNSAVFMGRKRLAETLASRALLAGAEPQIYNLAWYSDAKGIDDHLARAVAGEADPWVTLRQLPQKPAVEPRDYARLKKPLVDLTRPLDEELRKMQAHLQGTYQFLRQDERFVRVMRTEGLAESLCRLTSRIWTTPELRSVLCSHFRFYGKPRGNGHVLEEKAHPPDTLITSLATLSGWPVLDSVASVPCLRADGSLLSAEGYDAASGIWLAQDMRLPTLSANEALAAMKDVFRDFSFEDPELGLSVCVSFLLTVFCRAALPGAVPGLLINAPDGGAGKTLLMKVLYRIVTGEVMPTEAYKDGEEGKKQFVADLLEGGRVLPYDNVERGTKIGGGVLESYLTAEGVWKGRILGVNQNASIRASAVLLLNGNNAQISTDMGKRLLCVRLDKSDRARSRDELELIRHIAQPATQARILGALWALVRAWRAAGAPRPPAHAMLARGGFPYWTRLVQAVVMHHGLRDPLASVASEQVQVEGETEDLRELVFAIVRQGAASSAELLQHLLKSPEGQAALQARWPRSQPSVQQLAGVISAFGAWAAPGYPAAVLVAAPRGKARVRQWSLRDV